jgi:hypothetical protein
MRLRRFLRLTRESARFAALLALERVQTGIVFNPFTRASVPRPAPGERCAAALAAPHLPARVGSPAGPGLEVRPKGWRASPHAG